jgi:5'-3' exonuclease
MKDYLVFDANSLVYASQATTPLIANGMEVQAIYQTLKTIRSTMQRECNFTNVVMLWDDRAQFRIDLYPDYKGKRTDDPVKLLNREKIAAQRPILKKALRALGVTQMVSKGYEADDIAGFLTRRLNSANRKVRLCTGDKDWLQLINLQTDWFDPRERIERQCNRVTFEEFTGFQTTGQFVQAKALQGDNSDNIKGVGRIGGKSAGLIMRHFGSVEKMLAKHAELGGFNNDNLAEEMVKARMVKALNDFCTGAGLDLFKRNMAIMDLSSGDRDKDIQANLEIDRPKSKDWDEFADIVMELNMSSIYSNLDNWKRVFGGAA